MTAATIASPSKPTNPGLLASLLLIGGANSVLFSVLPPAGRHLGFVEWQIGLIVAFSAVAYMVAAAWWGRTSDIKGRRYVVVAGMVGFGLGGIAFAAVLDVGLLGFAPVMLVLILLIGARIAQSAISGGVYPAAQAYIAEATPPEKRAVALSGVTAAFALGTILGPAMAGLLVEIRITLPLYVIALLSLLAAQWCFVSMRPRPASTGERPLRLSARDPRVAIWIVMAMVYFVSVAGTQQILGFTVQDRLALDVAATARVTSMIFMAGGLVAVLFQVFVVRRSKWSATTLMIVGLVASVVMQVGLLLARDAWQFVAVALPLGISFACVSPGFSAAASIAVGAREQGAAAGLVAAAQAGGFLVGPLTFAVLYQFAPASPFLVGLGIAVVLLPLALSRKPTVT